MGKTNYGFANASLAPDKQREPGQMVGEPIAKGFCAASVRLSQYRYVACRHRAKQNLTVCAVHKKYEDAARQWLIENGVDKNSGIVVARTTTSPTVQATADSKTDERGDKRRRASRRSA